MAAAYAVVAFFVVAGLKPLGHFLEANESILRAGAGVFLLITGWRGLRLDPGRAPRRRARPVPRRILGQFRPHSLQPVPFATFSVILSRSHSSTPILTFPPISPLQSAWRRARRFSGS